MRRLRYRVVNLVNRIKTGWHGESGGFRMARNTIGEFVFGRLDRVVGWKEKIRRSAIKWIWPWQYPRRLAKAERDRDYWHNRAKGVGELGEEITQVTQQRNEARHECQQAWDSAKKAKASAKDFKGRWERLSNDVQALRVELENLRGREAALEKDLKRTRNAKDQLQQNADAKYSKIKAERDAARNESEERGESLKLANRRNQNLQNKNETLVRERESHMAEFDQRGTDLERCKKERVELEGRVSDLEERNESLANDLATNTAIADKAKEKIDILTIARDTARQDAQNMEARRDEAVKARNGSERELIAARATLTNTGNELVTRTKERDLALEKRDEAIAAKHNLIAERDDWKVRAEDAIGERDTFKAERDDLQRQLDDCKAIKGKLAGRVYRAEKERDASQAALTEKLGQLSEATKEVEALKATLANTQSDYDRLYKDYKAIEAKIETVKANNTNLSGNLETARTQIKVLKDDMAQANADYESLANDYDGQGKELEGIHERLDKANGDLSILGEQHNDRGKELEAAQAELASQKEIASTQKDRADELSEQVAEKVSEIRRLEAVVADLNHTIKRKNADIASTSAWRDDLQQKLDNANATVRSLKTVRDTRTDELGECRKLHTAAMKEIDNLEKNIATHQATIAGLESDYENLENRFRGMEKERDTERQDYNAAADTLAKVRAKLSEANETIKHLKEEKKEQGNSIGGLKRAGQLKDEKIMRLTELIDFYELQYGRPTDSKKE